MHIRTSNQEILEMGFGGYQCNWGLHICGLYETEKERDEIIYGFLHQGDLDGDRQFYCPVEQSKDTFQNTYTRLYPECQHHLHNPERFAILGARELYYPDGYFSPESMDQGLDAFYRESQKMGRKNIRATAEMVWAMEAIPGIEHLMVYESRLNYFIPGNPWVSICLD